MNKKKILIVDDEEDGIGLLYEEEFGDEGLAVSFATSGKDALSILEKERFDLVVLDIKMHGMDGIELLRRIKEKWKTLPVIISSAYHHYKQQFGTWAADAYVMKSSDMKELKTTIKDLLRTNTLCV